MLHSRSMPLTAQTKTAVLCHGAFTTKEQIHQFLLRNSIDNLGGCFVADETLYGCIGFPFQKVEQILQANERLDFLYIVINSPLDANLRVYDEFVFKNFPHTTALLKQIRQGGDTFVYKKNNRDVLFVKFHNIYEDEPFLQLKLK